MASSINASTSGAGGVITTADNSGILNLQSNGTTVATVSSTGFSTPANQTINTANTFGFKNRIINGGMVIDQRNNGASATITSTGNLQYVVDRWAGLSSVSSKFSLQQNSGSVTAPTGFTNYLGAVSLAATTPGSSDYYLIRQPIEGYNVADLGFGTANAKTVTISFWVRSSLTGTFSGSLNAAGYTRSYVFSYTINSANTWEQKSVTIAGDTTGTWYTTTSAGMEVNFTLGLGSTYQTTAGSWNNGAYLGATGATNVVATNGATWYVTGVQLEIGSQATSFDFREYERELILCQRYYFRLSGAEGIPAVGSGMAQSSTDARVYVKYPVTMRTSPSLGSGNLFILAANTAGIAASVTANYGGSTAAMLNITCSGGLSGSAQGTLAVVNTGSYASYYFDGSAEL